MRFDFGDLFTAEVRKVMPLARQRKLPIAFDCRPPSTTLVTDPMAASQALGRLLHAVLELVDVGFFAFDAVAQPMLPGRCTIAVKLAGTGLVAPTETFERVARRLWLDDTQPSASGYTARLRRASGRCPHTGGTIELSAVQALGILLSFHWSQVRCESASPLPTESANGRTAWLVNHDGVAAEALVRRLVRLGWNPRLFESAGAAERRLRALAPNQAQPGLVMVFADGRVTPLAAMQALDAQLSPSTQRVLLLDEPPDPLADTPPMWRIYPLPPSPTELRVLTSPAAAEPDTAPWRREISRMSSNGISPG